MTISFKYFPATTIRIPGIFAELDATRANTGQPVQRGLIIGQINTGSVMPTGSPIICEGVEVTAANAGNGSMLALMVQQWRQVDPFGELWLLPLADDGSSVKATGTVQITGAPTAAGTYCLYIAGQLVQTGVTSTMTTANVATALAAAVTANPGLPVTAAAVSSTVTFTAKNGGAAGNDIQLTENFLGAAGGQFMPTSMTTTVTAMASGATNPSLTTPLLNLANMTFDFIALPYNDATSCTSINNLLSDATGRWCWSQMLFGQAFNAYRGTLGSLTTFAATQNGDHLATMGFNASMSPYWLWATAYAAAVAVSARANPVQPITQIALPGIWAPLVQNRFVPSDRDTLLHEGISTYVAGNDGTVYIERACTNYQFNATGAPDNSWLDVETGYTAMASIRDYQTFLAANFSRKVLVSDATRVADSTTVTTAAAIAAAVRSRYRWQEKFGWVQNSDTVCPTITAEDDGNGQVRVLLPADYGNQLRQIAILVDFVKS
jgi:phage tail sheath gpL-like